MMMNGELPSLFDVWKFAFAYEDVPGKVKERPVIVGAIDNNNAMLLAVKVSSHEPREDCVGEVAIRDWKDAGLDKPSTARCSKTLIVPIESFSNCHRYGRLSSYDALSIEQMLNSLGKVI